MRRDIVQKPHEGQRYHPNIAHLNPSRRAKHFESLSPSWISVRIQSSRSFHALTSRADGTSVSGCGPQLASNRPQLLSPLECPSS